MWSVSQFPYDSIGWRANVSSVAIATSVLPNRSRYGINRST